MSASRTQIIIQIMKQEVAGLLLGVGIAMGSIPILIASIMMGDNLFIEIVDRMDSYWKK